MATDNRINLWADVQAHINNRLQPDLFKPAVVEPARNVITRTMRERTRNEQQITGESMPPLGKTYRDKKKKMTGSSRPDLRYGFNKDDQRKAKAMDSLHTQVRDSKNGYDIGYYFSPSADDKHLSATQYMSMHQTGKLNVGQKTQSTRGKRKWFPSEDVAETAGVVVLEKEVEKLISRHMNKGAISRTIVIG